MSAISASRRAPDALADAVDEARGNESADGWRQREHRLGDGRQSITEGGKHLALAQSITERTGEDLDDGGRGLGDALDDADRQVEAPITVRR
jgi:hypothetical protein